jgi:hypothetical protein
VSTLGISPEPKITVGPPQASDAPSTETKPTRPTAQNPPALQPAPGQKIPRNPKISHTSQEFALPNIEDGPIGQ